MSNAVITVGVLELIFGGIALVFFVVEFDRLPGTWLRWSPYIESRSDFHSRGVVTIGVRRKNSYVALCEIALSSPDFDEKIAEAESQARERCVLLNAGERGMRRRLPA